MKFSIVIVLCLIISSCNGVFYPKKTYAFNYGIDSPPFSERDRLELATSKNQELLLLFRRRENNFNYSLILNALVKKTYKELHISKLLYKTELEEEIIFKDLKYELPVNVRTIGDFSDKYSYSTINGDYYSCTIDVTSNLMKKIPKVDFYKYFNEYEIGDRFNVDLIFYYSFDNEESKILTQTFSVEVRKGKYMSPFFGLH